MWTLEETDECFVIKDEGRNIAMVSDPEAARLMVAAKEMLAVLKKYLRTCEKPLGMSELADIDAETRTLLRSIGELK